MAVAKRARRRLGAALRQDSQARARPDAHHPVLHFNVKHAKLPYRRTRRSMSDSKTIRRPARSWTSEAQRQLPSACFHASSESSWCWPSSLYFAVAGLYLGLRYVVLPQVDVVPAAHRAARLVEASRAVAHRQAHRALVGLPAGARRRQSAHRCRRWRARPRRAARERERSSWRSLLQSRADALEPDRRWPRRDHSRARGRRAVASRACRCPTHRTGNNAFTTWLLSQQAIVLRDGTLRWRDARARGAGDRAEAPAARDHQRRHAPSARAAGARRRRRAARPARLSRGLPPSAVLGDRRAGATGPAAPTCRPARSICRCSRAT